MIQLSPNIDWNWLNITIDAVAMGSAKKIVKDNVSVYKCGTIVRIDIKDLPGGHVRESVLRKDVDEYNEYPYTDMDDLSMMP